MITYKHGEKRAKKRQRNQKRHEARVGKILTMFNHVENSLEEFITKYAFNHNLLRGMFVGSKLIFPLNFYRKEKIFLEICKEEGFYTIAARNEMEKLLEYLRTTRNSTAHGSIGVDNRELENDEFRRVMNEARKKFNLPEHMILDENFCKVYSKKFVRFLDLYMKFYDLMMEKIAVEDKDAQIGGKYYQDIDPLDKLDED